MPVRSGKVDGAAVAVMIVEDDHESRERFAAALSHDARTRVAALAMTGREAIALLPGARPDVLLIDLGLPDMHGSELIRRARRVLPGCDVMVLSLFGDERNVMASIEAGATGYLLKDCSDADLVASVLELHAGGAPMNPGIARRVLERLRVPNPAPESAAANLLTARETDVLRLLARGHSYAEIAAQLGISANTVMSHIKGSYRKLAVHSGAAAVAKAGELGLLPSGAGGSARR